MSNLHAFCQAYVGIRKSGKTVLALKNLITKWKMQFDLVVIVSPTWALQNQTRIIDPTGVLVITGFTDDVFVKMLHYAKNHLGIRMLIVVDDVAGKYRQAKNALDQIFTTGRHYGISVLILAQKLTQLTRDSRNQLDEICLFSEANLRELKFVHGDFGSGMNLNEFIQILALKTKEPFSYMKILNIGGKLIIQ